MSGFGCVSNIAPSSKKLCERTHTVISTFRIMNVQSVSIIFQASILIARGLFLLKLLDNQTISHNKLMKDQGQKI